jgi:hypothetical protein
VTTIRHRRKIIDWLKVSVVMPGRNSRRELGQDPKEMSTN